LIDAAAYKFPPRPGQKQSGSHFPAEEDSEPKKKRKKRSSGSDGEVDEVTSFNSRPKAAVNRPMILQPVDKARRQAIELSLAQVDPTASFEDRVIQFDNMAAIAKKRELKTNVFFHAFLLLLRQSYITSVRFSAVNTMPDDVVEFLESIFDKPMDTWVHDPGYATRVIGMCPPPSNSSILVSSNFGGKNSFSVALPRSLPDFLC
jgi:hypothetical protein